MSHNPFTADPEIAARQQRLNAEIGARLTEAIGALLLPGDPDRNAGAVIFRQDVDALISRFGLTGVEELMLLALDAARRIATPPISGFFVGAVGLERETGNLILGGNLEFPRTHLGFTVHGEGFVFTRAASRGTSIATIAIGEAHPCAHCRQYLSEFAATRDLVLIDPLGHRLTMAQLYPWPFDPDYLGDPGYTPGLARPDLALAANTLPPRTAERLIDAGRRAHAPYSKCPGAIVLTLSDGNLVSGFAIESVAFNPTMGPLQAAMINLVAHGYSASDIASAVLATSLGADVDYALSTSELLGKLAPAAPLTILGWA